MFSYCQFSDQEEQGGSSTIQVYRSFFPFIPLRFEIIGLTSFFIFSLPGEGGVRVKTFLLTSGIIMGNLKQKGIVEGGLQWEERIGKT